VALRTVQRRQGDLAHKFFFVGPHADRHHTIMSDSVTARTEYGGSSVLTAARRGDLWTPTGINVPDYHPKLAQLWWADITRR